MQYLQKKPSWKYVYIKNRVEKCTAQEHIL
jgi:hypothetical protein